MKLTSCEADFILPLRYENVNRESEVYFIFWNSGLLSIKLSYVTLRHMSILAGSETGPIAFEGERGISRGAAAAIIARLVDSECRIIF